MFGKKSQKVSVSENLNAANILGQGTVSLKDLIAPSFIEVDFNNLKIDDKYYRTLYVVGYPRYINANWLYSLITFDHPLYISMYIYPTESKNVLDEMKRKIGEMEATIENDIKAGRMVDPVVQVSLDDALALQAELAKGAERFFQFGLYITIPADSKEELETLTKQVDSVLASRLLMMDVDVIIIDPENEYKKLCESMGGEFVEFAANSQYKINPFDLPKHEAEPDELSNKILDLHALMKVIMGDLTPSQDALLDRSLVVTYKEKGITQEVETFKNQAPLLEDLYKVFLGMETPEAREMADRLDKFVKGSAAGIFNSQSNFDLKQPFTVFGIRDLEENLRPVAMYIVLDYIWNVVRKDKRKRVLIVDEAWYLIKQKDSGAYLHSFAKRARKYMLGLTTITQDVEDFLATDEGKAIITNSSLQIILKQSSAAVDRISQTFYLTGGEKHFLLSAGVGEGLFFAGQSHVGFQVIASEEEKGLIE